MKRWDEISFEEKFAQSLHLLPHDPSSILDIGSGTGVDAEVFASHGHNVVAVEPTEELRQYAIENRNPERIEWVDDGLPSLRSIAERGAVFDLITIIAVWMHLDPAERSQAMHVVASLLRPGGRIIMSLRYGPVPQGRRMFEVTPEETIGLAVAEGLQTVLKVESASVQAENRLAGVTWTHLAFERLKPVS